jgi:hypothetical protein
MLNTDQKNLIEFVEDRAARLSIRKRIKVYRGLADFIDDKSVASPLVRKAQILEDAECRCAQLNLKFLVTPNANNK